jgi:tripartite-type tricarboxylate transporter receptor subunit TctC
MRADTPAPIVAKVEQACKGAVADAAFKDMARKQFQQTDYLDSAQFSARLQADLRSKGELLKTVKLDR